MNFRDFERPVVLTGAGMSAASGLPTYRGEDGLWTKDPDHGAGLVPPPKNMTNPDERRDWWNRLWDTHFGPMREAGISAKPNAGHIALAEWGKDNPDLCILTQNVDGLHRDAGSTEVVELHGNLWMNRCAKRRCSQPAWEDREVRSSAPDCPKCGRPSRPDVVLFTEDLSERNIAASHRVLWKCDLILCLGTTLGVWPVNTFPSMARQFGAKLAIINVGPTEWDGPVDFGLDAPIEDCLPELLK